MPITPAIRQAWKAMDLPGPVPAIFSTPLPPNIAGEAPWPRIPSKSRVLLAPNVAEGLNTLGFAGHRDLQPLAVLLHEFAHTRQPMTLNRPTFEGGAEAYAQSRFQTALKLLGITNGYVFPDAHNPLTPHDRYPFPTYMDFTGRIARSGWNAVNRAQFGR